MLVKGISTVAILYSLPLSQAGCYNLSAAVRTLTTFCRLSNLLVTAPFQVMVSVVCMHSFAR